VNIASISLWGLVATLVLATIMTAGQGLGLSRISLPYVLGTMFTPSRDRANAIGFVVHLVIGWAFSLGYALIFESWHRATWWLGAALGLAHGIVVLVAVLPILPGFHPRMATEERGPEPTRELEPPGFLALNYGRRTPEITLAAHVIYGTIIGAFYQLSALR
jgi:uncharacterized membrane protein YagU involved in acid resistance